MSQDYFPNSGTGSPVKLKTSRSSEFSHTFREQDPGHEGTMGEHRDGGSLSAAGTPR